MQTARKATSNAGTKESAGVARGSESGALTGGMPGRPAPLAANGITWGKGYKREGKVRRGRGSVDGVKFRTSCQNAAVRFTRPGYLN